MAIQENHVGDIRPIKIDPSVILKQAKGSIKNIMDSLVELVTNSDDSYNRLEECI